MRVRDYLDHRARLFGLRRSDRRSGIAMAAEQCRVADVLARRVGQLSKGYKQRVGMAAALVHNPPVLVLDEPTSGLDPTQIRETRSLIRTLAANRTVLVSSHILPEVEKTCDRVIIIAGGCVRADASPRHLIETARGLSVHTVQVFAPINAQREQILLRIRAGLPKGAEVSTEGADLEGWATFTIKPTSEEPDVREMLVGLLARGGGGGVRVREISRVTPSLEQVFVSLIEQEA